MPDVKAIEAFVNCLSVDQLPTLLRAVAARMSPLQNVDPSTEKLIADAEATGRSVAFVASIRQFAQRYGNISGSQAQALINLIEGKTKPAFAKKPVAHEPSPFPPEYVGPTTDD